MSNDFKNLKVLSVSECMKECILSLECVAITFTGHCYLFNMNLKIEHQIGFKAYSKTGILWYLAYMKTEFIINSI